MLREETGREKVVIRQSKRAWNLEDKLRRGEGSKIVQAYLREILGRDRRGRKREFKMVCRGGQRMERNRIGDEVETR